MEDKTARSDALRGCLAAAGLAASLWPHARPPELDGHAVVVVPADGIAPRLEALRAVAPRAAVVAIDVVGPADTTAVIRAGAGDMLLRDAPDADLPPKVRRLLRRRRL